MLDEQCKVHSDEVSLKLQRAERGVQSAEGGPSESFAALLRATRSGGQTGSLCFCSRLGLCPDRSGWNPNLRLANSDGQQQIRPQALVGGLNRQHMIA